MSKEGEGRGCGCGHGAGHPGGPCGCASDPVVNRVLDQQAMRYNGREAFSNNAAMDNNNMMQMQFLTDSSNQLQQNPGTQLASTLSQLAGVINGRPTNTVGGADT